jgi:hypothetical protein
MTNWLTQGRYRGERALLRTRLCSGFVHHAGLLEAKLFQVAIFA